MRAHLAFAVLAIVALLMGCAAVGPTAEQMKAMEGLSASLCIKSPGWNGSEIAIHYSSFGGKSVGSAGGGGKVTCGSSVVEFTNEGKVVKPEKP